MCQVESVEAVFSNFTSSSKVRWRAGDGKRIDHDGREYIPQNIDLIVAVVNHADEGTINDFADVDLSAPFLWFQAHDRREFTIFY